MQLALARDDDSGVPITSGSREKSSRTGQRENRLTMLDWAIWLQHHWTRTDVHEENVARGRAAKGMSHRAGGGVLSWGQRPTWEMLDVTQCLRRRVLFSAGRLVSLEDNLSWGSDGDKMLVAMGDGCALAVVVVGRRQKISGLEVRLRRGSTMTRRLQQLERKTRKNSGFCTVRVDEEDQHESGMS